MPLHANVDIPAPLAAGLLAALVGGSAVLFGVWFLAWWRLKPRGARAALWLLALSVAAYGAAMWWHSARSLEKTLGRGVEKYFCELDCHLAYSVVSVEKRKTWRAEGGRGVARVWDVGLRTRFDEQTITPRRPKGAPLKPEPRQARVVARDGRVFFPAGVEGPALATPLRPGESYLTHLLFELPADAEGPRLLLTGVGWPARLAIGSENSPGHRKTYFALE